jgi:DNA-binding NarL/FixJ family response regulator
LSRFDTSLTPDSRHHALRLGTKDEASLRVVLADDHLMVLEILSDTLTTHARMEITKASTFQDALALAEAACDVDLIVLDFDMHGMRGYEGLARMVALGKAPVAILAGVVHPGMAEAVQAAGGIGLLSKTQGVFDIVQRLLDLGRGGSFFHPADRHETQADAMALSDMQARVMRMIEAGLSNKDIGTVLGIPLSTVKMHVRAIFKRLDAKNRTDSVRIWHDGAASGAGHQTGAQ